MIRFVVKTALLLGIAATVLPLASGSHRPDGPSIDLFGVAMGMRDAAADLGGFCDRAPRACSAAGDVTAYAVDRIEAGFAIGYAYLSKTSDAPAEPTRVAGPAEAVEAPDPVLTGAVEPFGPPRPYVPPRRQIAATATPPHAVAFPTPAPRT